MKISPLLIPTLIASAMVTGCGAAHDTSVASKPQPKASVVPFVVKGSVNLSPLQYSVMQGTEDGTAYNFCFGAPGYDDITGEAQVVIKGSTGQTVGIGSLNSGENMSDGSCRLEFTVKDVPPQKFYSVEIAGRHGLQFTETDLRTPERLALKFG